MGSLVQSGRLGATYFGFARLFFFFFAAVSDTSESSSDITYASTAGVIGGGANKSIWVQGYRQGGRLFAALTGSFGSDWLGFLHREEIEIAIIAADLHSLTLALASHK